MLNEALKSCRKMIYTDIKTDVKQKIKELVVGQIDPPYFKISFQEELI